MLTDPQSVTINGAAKSMPRIRIDGQKAVYSTADGLFTETVSHQLTKGRVRSMMRLDQRAIVADPLTSVNDYDTLSLYVVVDRPEVGFTSAQLEYLRVGLFTQLDATLLAKIFGLEF